jgi:hypothetical protein
MKFWEYNSFKSLPNNPFTVAPGVVNRFSTHKSSCHLLDFMAFYGNQAFIEKNEKKTKYFINQSDAFQIMLFKHQNDLF